MKTLAENLKRLRVGRALTQVQLAAACGLTQSAISRYEKDKEIPGLSSLLKLAMGLNVTLETLVEEIDVKFDAVYKGLRLSIQAEPGPPDSGAEFADARPSFDQMIPGAPPPLGTPDDAPKDLAEAHARLNQLASDILSIASILPRRSDPVARPVGPGVRRGAVRHGPRARRPHSPKTSTQKRR